MKTKFYVLKRMMEVLNELESGKPTGEVKNMLRHQLSVYNEILDDEDLPEEYWERIEKLV